MCKDFNDLTPKKKKSVFAILSLNSSLLLPSPGFYPISNIIYLRIANLPESLCPLCQVEHHAFFQLKFQPCMTSLLTLTFRTTSLPWQLQHFPCISSLAFITVYSVVKTFYVFISLTSSMVRCWKAKVVFFYITTVSGTKHIVGTHLRLLNWLETNKARKTLVQNRIYNTGCNQSLLAWKQLFQGWPEMHTQTHTDESKCYNRVRHFRCI